jgi:outer membrane assembly lipoprotein YfiO
MADGINSVDIIMMFKARLYSVVTLLFCVALIGCSSMEIREETSGWSAERIYQEAHGAMAEGNYTRAVSLFESLEARYPYGRYAQQAVLESAYANFRMKETDAAIAACNRFIRLYPNHPSVDYVYYLKGLVYFREDLGIFGYIYEQDLSERDPHSLKESFDAFKELLDRFPDSRYAEDSEYRMTYLANALGMHEVHAARYYYNRGAYLAAINRAEASLVEHPMTPSNEEALGLMVASYEKLGMDDLAADARRVLEASFPESVWINGPPREKPWWLFWKFW